jgi:DNA repair exonuclease SbcCD ATPase subunit
MSNSDFVNLLESSEGLTEQFKTSASQLFEQAVDTKVESIINERLEEQKKELAEEAATYTHEYTAGKIQEALETQKQELAEEAAEFVRTYSDTKVTEAVDALKEEYSVRLDEVIAEKMDLQEQLEKLDERFEDAVNYEAAKLAESEVKDMREKLAAYTDYVAEQFVNEHRDMIVNESKVWMAEGIMESVRNLFAEYGIGAEEADQCYESKIAKLTKERDEAYEQLAEAVEAKFDAERKLEESARKDAFDELTASCTEIDRQRIAKLMEDDSSSLDQYREKVKTLAESMVTSVKPVVGSPVNVVSSTAPKAPVEEKTIAEDVDPEVAYLAKILESGKARHY